MRDSDAQDDSKNGARYFFVGSGGGEFHDLGARAGSGAASADWLSGPEAISVGQPGRCWSPVMRRAPRVKVK